MSIKGQKQLERKYPLFPDIHSIPKDDWKTKYLYDYHQATVRNTEKLLAEISSSFNFKQTCTEMEANLKHTQALVTELKESLSYFHYLASKTKREPNNIVFRKLSLRGT